VHACKAYVARDVHEHELHDTTLGYLFAVPRCTKGSWSAYFVLLVLLIVFPAWTMFVCGLPWFKSNLMTKHMVLGHPVFLILFCAAHPVSSHAPVRFCGC
jgi:hypothetical protein